jgi:hypothetical protein
VKLPRQADLWLSSYLHDRAAKLTAAAPKRLWVALTDHFEPMGGKVSLEVGGARVGAWEYRWPAIAAAAPRDSAGNAPCFTAFYPQEEYEPALLDRLAAMTRTGTMDVEVHLHHDDDTAASFSDKVGTFTAQLRNNHGLLHDHNGRTMFGFIHGNWALDNSRPDGRWCGVTGELQLLRDLGCYADFTMPSAPSRTQSRIVNQIYWTTGDPSRPRGFDQGVQATPGGGTRGDLLMITGPLGLRYRERLVPRLETGELSVYDPPTPYRVERWLSLAPRLGDDIFLKLYGHSAREDNAGALLGTNGSPGKLAAMFGWIYEAAQARNLELHWVSAYEMFRAADSLIQPAHIKPAQIQPAAGASR